MSPLTAGGTGSPEFSFEVAPDGTFDFAVGEEEPAPVQPLAPNGCSDSTYKITPWEMMNAYEWYVGDGGMPGGLSLTAAQTAFADAINNITGGYNNCGISDTIDANSYYKGRTSYESDINSSNQCTARDKKSTWDAGNLAAGTLAVNCTWYTTTSSGSTTYSLEGDVRYNTTDFNFTNSPTASCSNKWDVRAVGTHEAGHAFGLDHAPGAPTQTMYYAIDECDTSYRTLGKGDMKGLEYLY
ncbi:matrixin family metalloprotease [Streptomyces sp. NBC_01511]|uniref:matrixin family metalloprotease n=1 Tax=unclassified Streptomyces TaxID=2593676 RepID=UPI003866205D